MLLPGTPRVIQALSHSCPVATFSSVVSCSYIKDKRQGSFKGLEEKYVVWLVSRIAGEGCLCVVRATVECAQDQLSFCGPEESVML